MYKRDILSVHLIPLDLNMPLPRATAIKLYQFLSTKLLSKYHTRQSALTSSTYLNKIYQLGISHLLVDMQ